MSDSLVIVAIPAEDDYVMEVSSEKVPHMTLLYLGEPGSADLESIIGFVEHAATLIEPFYMDVEYRGTLGEDDADVIFFEKGWDYKRIFEFRENLKKTASIKVPFLENDKFPEWTPHLTLGYPTSPAHEPEKERKLYTVRFDRIAVWDGDFKGMEFRLKNQPPKYDMAMSEVSASETALSHFTTQGRKWGIKARDLILGQPPTETDDEIKHYGVKGMRWGYRSSRGPAGTATGGNGTVRVSKPSGGGGVAAKADVALRPTRAIQNAKANKRDRTQVKREGRFPSQPAEYRVSVSKKGHRVIETRGGKGQEPAPEAVSAKVLNQQRRASGVHTLSNQQLRELATRLQLEKQVTDLTAQPQGGTVRKFIEKNLMNPKEREKNIKNVDELGKLFSGKSSTSKPRK